MLVGIVIFMAMLLFLYLWGKKIGDFKLILTLWSGWVIKCLAAFSFFYVYSEIYGDGELAEDAGAYYQEAKILNTIYHDNPSAYTDVIFNRNDYENTIYQYFKNVKYSRIGPNANFINDTRNQIKFISLLTLVIGEDVMAVFSFFTLLSFLGLLVLWHVVSLNTSLNKLTVFTLLLLPISLLFWTTNPLKESTSFFGYMLFLAFWLNKNKSSLWYGIGLMGFVFALLFKPYLFPFLFVASLLVYFFKKIFRDKKWSYSFTLLIFFAFLVYFDLPNKTLHSLSDKQFDFVNVARGGVHVKGDTCYYFIEKENRNLIHIDNSIVHLKTPTAVLANRNGKIRQEKRILLQPQAEQLSLEYEQIGGASYFDIQPLNRSWVNFFLSLPQALINGFFRPFPWTNFLSLGNILFSIENIFFTLLLFITLHRIGFNRERIRTQVAILLLSAFMLTLVIGFTTPISGAIVRYRVPVHLFILISYLLTFSKHEATQK